MGFFFMLIVSLAASYVIGGLLAQFPDDVAPDDTDPFKRPQSTPSNPVPIVFGTRRIRGVNTLWYGKISWTAITKDVKAGFKKSKVTTGYMYFVGMQIGIAYGFAGMVHKSLYIGEDRVHNEDISSGTVGTFKNVGLYGGEEQGGGVQGQIVFYNGIDNLAVQGFLPSALGTSTEIPKYGSTAQIVLKNNRRGMYIGTSKQVRAISCVISNVNFFGAGVAPHTDGLDVNPVTVLRHILVTDPRFLVLTGNEIDLHVLNEVEQAVWDEGILFSPIFARAKSTENMLDVILKLIDAVFYTDPLSGKLTLKLLRELVPTGVELTLDNSNVVKVIKTTIPARSKTINEVKLTFTDRGHNYDDRTITAQDLAAFITAGEVHNTKVINYPSICTIEVARQICDRDLMQLSKPATTLELDVNRELADSVIGDQVIIVLDEIGITNAFFRITAIDYGTLGEGIIRVTLISDVYTGNISVYSAEQGSAFVDPIGVNNTVEITDALFVELPRILLRTLVDIDPLVGLDTEWGMLILAPWTNTDNLMYDGYADTYDNGIYDLTTTEHGFTPHAVLVSDFSRDKVGNFFSNTHEIQFSEPSEFPDDSIVYDLQNRKEPVRYVYMVGEWMTYTSLEDLGGGVYSLNNLRRGAFDSWPKDHVTGDVVYFVSDAESLVYAQGIIYADRSVVDVKLNPMGIGGEFGIANVVGFDTVTSENRAFLPLPASYLRFSSEFYRTLDNPQFGSSCVLLWRHHDRNDFDDMWLQGNTDVLEANISYTLKVYKSDATTVLRTVIGITTNTWTYTKAMELADQGYNSKELFFEIISIHSVDGSCLEPRFESVYFGGYGLNYGNTYGR